SSTALRPSVNASSLRPRAASIKPSTHRAPASSGRARTTFSCSTRAAVKAARAFESSFAMRAIRPSPKRGLYFTVLLPKPFSPNAAKAFAAAAGVAFCQCANEPAIGHTLDRTVAFRAEFIDQLMHGSCISFPVAFHLRAGDFQPGVIRLDR